MSKIMETIFLWTRSTASATSYWEGHLEHLATKIDRTDLSRSVNRFWTLNGLAYFDPQFGQKARHMISLVRSQHSLIDAVF